MDNKQAQNSDTELWRQPTTTFTDSEGEKDSGMEPSVFVTASGAIGFNHYGTCFVKTIKEWVELAKKESIPPVQSKEGEK